MKEYQTKIDTLLQKYDEPYWAPLSQFARVSEEVGEVGRILNHMYGSKPKKENEPSQDLGEELADVIFAIICIANKHSIDLNYEMDKVILKSQNRDKDRFKLKSE